MLSISLLDIAIHCVIVAFMYRIVTCIAGAKLYSFLYHIIEQKADQMRKYKIVNKEIEQNHREFDCQCAIIYKQWENMIDEENKAISSYSYDHVPRPDVHLFEEKIKAIKEKEIAEEVKSNVALFVLQLKGEKK